MRPLRAALPLSALLLAAACSSGAGPGSSGAASTAGGDASAAALAATEAFLGTLDDAQKQWVQGERSTENRGDRAVDRAVRGSPPDRQRHRRRHRHDAHAHAMGGAARVVRVGRHQRRAAVRETTKAFALVDALDATQQQEAILDTEVTEIVLGAGQDGKTPAQEGVSASTFTAEQKQLLCPG